MSKAIEEKRAGHTAGPWQADKWAGDDWTVSAPDSQYSVCHLADCNNAEANAKLIAAAPELLDALILALPYIETAEADKAYKPGAVAKVTKQLRAVIERAEGRS